MFERILNSIKLLFDEIREEKSLYPVLKGISLFVWIIPTFLFIKVVGQRTKNNSNYVAIRKNCSELQRPV